MADNLTTFRNSQVGSEKLLYYVSVPKDLTNPKIREFRLALLQAESNKMDANVESEDIPDVTSKVPAHVIKAYKKSFSHSGTFLAKDPVNKYEEYLFTNEVVDEVANCELIVHHSYAEGGKVAEKYPAVCEVTSFGGEAQGKLKIEAKYTVTGSPVKGTVTVTEDGVATFVAAG